MKKSMKKKNPWKTKGNTVAVDILLFHTSQEETNAALEPRADSSLPSPPFPRIIPGNVAPLGLGATE